MIPLFQPAPRPRHPLLADDFKRDTIRMATNWRVRPIFSAESLHNEPRRYYGWNLIDPRGLVRRSFMASLDEVADVARQEMKGMRT